jgi:glycosyltransferase involved in cell wall biosynthesis
MKVVHVIPFLWSGAGRVLTDLCISQSTHHDVTIVTSGNAKGMSDWPFYRRRLSANGIQHRRIDFFDRDPAVYWKSVRQLADCVSQIHPDVVHCHSGVPACAAATVRDANPGSFRLISQLHSWGNGRPEWMNTMDISGFNRSDLIIVNAASYRRILLNAGMEKNRIVSLPWGVAPEALEEVPLMRRDSGRIGFVGRIEPRKGQLDLVEAFDLLRRKRPSLRLELLGPGADVAYVREIEKMIRVQRMSNCVWLGGQVRNVYRHERNWELFVSMSNDEGQGMAILEAMALGVPVVARNCPGVQDYLRDGKNAIALKSDSVRTVAQTMQWALDHPETTLKLSVKAREMVRNTYAWERTVLGMETIYGIWENSGLASNG